MADFWKPDLDANRFGLQWSVFNSKARCLLVAGPRLSAKTWATLHKIVRHMYDTPGARVAMFSKTMKNSKEGGTWLDMHGTILKEWIDAGVVNYASHNNEGEPGWKVIGDTRTPYFSIRNRYGGISDCRLFSLDHVPDIVDKVKEQRFSLIYFSELMKFDSPVVLSSTTPCLRMPHLRYEDHLWMADTNPSELGDQSWIHDVWYKERLQTYAEYLESSKEKGIDPQPEADWQIIVSGLELIEMFPEDNLRIDRRQLIELKERCKHDPGLYSRDVLGKWVWGDGDSSRHFRSFFKPAIHVAGNIEPSDESEWEVIKPNPNSVELVTGWDPGDVNHAAVLLDQVYRNNRKCFAVLEELESIKQNLSIEEFTLEFFELIEELERDTGIRYKLDRAYSDASALEKYSAVADSFPALEVRAATHGRIILIGVPKPEGSVRLRVNLVKQLLAQERLKISAHCVAVQRMLRDLKKGQGRINYVVRDENKHIFDALSYPLLAECHEELVMQEERLNVAPRHSLLVQA